MIDTLEYWKDHEHESPGMAAFARDILCIPAGSVGVERTLNVARDVCHYRRGRLAPETIRAIMLTRHYEKAIQEDGDGDRVVEETIVSDELTTEQVAQEEALRSLEIEEEIKAQYISEEEIEQPQRWSHVRRRSYNLEQEQSLHYTPLSIREARTQRANERARQDRIKRPNVYSMESSPSTTPLQSSQELPELIPESPSIRLSQRSNSSQQLVYSPFLIAYL
jgi:hypothetical protein